MRQNAGDNSTDNNETDNDARYGVAKPQHGNTPRSIQSTLQIPVDSRFSKITLMFIISVIIQNGRIGVSSRWVKASSIFTFATLPKDTTSTQLLQRRLTNRSPLRDGNVVFDCCRPFTCKCCAVINDRPFCDVRLKQRQYVVIQWWLRDSESRLAF